MTATAPINTSVGSPPALAPVADKAAPYLSAATTAKLGPQNIADALSRIPKDSSTVKVEVIVDDNGDAMGIVAYASGIPGLAPLSLDPRTWVPFVASVPGFFTGLLTAAFTSAFGGETISGAGYRSVSNQLNREIAYVDANYTPSPRLEGHQIPIMLVGHSNGGQQFQVYATGGKYKSRVVEVITFGSPIIKKASEYGPNNISYYTEVLHIIDPNDPIPGAAYQPAAARTFLPALSESNEQQRGYWSYRGGPTGTRAHNLDNYARLAARFDELSTSQYFNSYQPGYYFRTGAVGRATKFKYGI